MSGTKTPVETLHYRHMAVLWHILEMPAWQKHFSKKPDSIFQYSKTAPWLSKQRKLVLFMSNILHQDLLWKAVSLLVYPGEEKALRSPHCGLAVLEGNI